MSRKRASILSRRELLAQAIAVASVGPMTFASGGTMIKRPNVLFILTDQWRGPAFGYAGDPNVKTPNIDRFAQESFNFENAVSVCPVCTPYRASLMTGRFPTSTGMFLNDLYLPDEELCLAEVFRKGGYTTGYIGKWHLDGHGRADYIPPERRQGFEYWKAAECDHNYTHSHYYEGTSDEKLFWRGFDAFSQTKDAQEYMRRHSGQGKPYFLMVAYGGPHFPHSITPEEFRALYPKNSLTLRPNVPEDMREAARDELVGYYAHCTALDDCVGELLNTLHELGAEQDTLVVFTSDHGEMMGSHDWRPCVKQTVWNESASVPFLLRYPALHESTPRTLRMPINTPDIMPTLLSMAGLSIPASVEGDDWSDVVRGVKGEPDIAALYMSVAPFDVNHEMEEFRAIRTARYTYARNLKGPWVLFDNVHDPYQLTNLVDEKVNVVLRNQLDERLQRRLAQIGDAFHARDFYIQRWGYSVEKNGNIPYGLGATVQSPRR